MASNSPQIADAFVEVAGDLLEGSGGLINYLQRNFFVSGQVQQGDDFMDQSRDLLTKHLQLIQLNEQTRIRHDYTRARHAKDKLDDFDGSKFQKYFQARKYKRRAKKSFKIIKKASDRAVDDRLMDRIVEAEHGNGAGTGPVESAPRDPFTDSHAISTLTNVAANDIDEMDMSTFQNEDTGESAVVLDLRGRDSSTQHIVATFPTRVLSGDCTNGEAPQSVSPGATAALSVHKEDGSSPRLITTPLPNVSSRQTTDEGDVEAYRGEIGGAETNSISSFDENEVYAASENGE